MCDKDSQPDSFVFDPRVFIHKPYRECPSCKAEGTFGVLSIGPYHYVRRCRECWHDASFPLPELEKKVLYLDQFAISNMMKALNPKVESEADGFWLDLFRKVDRLCKLQLLVCPQSRLHTEEALVAPFGPALKRMYELLSGGITLHSRPRVERTQILEHVQRWASGREAEPWQFDLRAVANGDPGAWPDRLLIVTEWTNVGERVADIRRRKVSFGEAVMPVFQRWQQEQGAFWKCFSEEARSYRLILELYTQYYERLEKIRNGGVPPSLEGMLPPPAVATVETIHEALKKGGAAGAELWGKTVEYLSSDAVERLPFNRISALLTAAVARKAAAGQKRPITSGVSNDIQFISAYLPYCDAMLIDNECYTLLMEQPVRDELAPYKCRLFCKNTKDELLSYLEGIEANAPPEHLATVKEVYGEDWGKPYETMYAGDQT